MKIKGNEVTRKDESTAVVLDMSNSDCKVELRSVEIGGNTITPITGEDSHVKMGVSITYPNGHVELINQNITCKLSDIGLDQNTIDLFRARFVAQICGEVVS